MEIQHPVRRLEHPASFHERAHGDALLLVLVGIGQEEHRDAFARAPTRGTDVRTEPKAILGVFVRAKALDRPVSVIYITCLAFSFQPGFLK